MFKNSTKIKVVFYLFLLICLTGNCSVNKELNTNAALSASNTNTSKTDKRVLLLDGQISFVPPDGFKAIQIGQLKRKGAENDSPKNIFSNESQSAYIKIYFGEVDLEPNQLKDTKEFVEKTHQKFSKWITSEIIEMNSRQWFHFEWETPSENADLVAPAPIEEDSKPETKDEKKPVHYREYTTSLNKKNLRFVFESDAKEYPQIKDTFNKSIQTIQVKEK